MSDWDWIKEIENEIEEVNHFYSRFEKEYRGVKPPKISLLSGERLLSCIKVLRETLEFYGKEPGFALIHPGTSKEYVAEMVPPVARTVSATELEIPPELISGITPYGSIAREALAKCAAGEFE